MPRNLIKFDGIKFDTKRHVRAQHKALADCPGQLKLDQGRQILRPTWRNRILYQPHNFCVIRYKFKSRVRSFW